MVADCLGVGHWQGTASELHGGRATTDGGNGAAGETGASEEGQCVETAAAAESVS